MIVLNRHRLPIAVAALLYLVVNVQLQNEAIGAETRTCKVEAIECKATCGAPRLSLDCDAPVKQCRSQCGTFQAGDFTSEVIYGLASQPGQLSKEPADFEQAVKTGKLDEWAKMATPALTQFLEELRRYNVPAKVYWVKFEAEPNQVPRLAELRPWYPGEIFTVKGPFVGIIFDMEPADVNSLQKLSPATLIDEGVKRIQEMLPALLGSPG